MVHGREEEVQIMQGILDSNRAEMLAVIGRRRVGKTFLIKAVYREHFVFDFTGTHNAERDNQLKKFTKKLLEYDTNRSKISIPKDWNEAFDLLKDYLKSLRKSKRKRIIFFDEVPWIDTHKSGFADELGYWWNDWAVDQSFIVVICGSAATWMIDHVITDTGGLHNRVTRQVELEPFTLAETYSFLDTRGVKMDHYHILQLYMAVGGIPLYLSDVQPGESATQAINRMCFRKGGILKNEFENLYAALFDHYENHISVIRALASKWKGLTRQEIIKHSGFSDGGGLTKILTELEKSSFISSYKPLFNKRKGTLYRLTDEYSLFYIHYMDGRRYTKRDPWLQISTSRNYQSWCGYAFESICIKHVDGIVQKLGISGMATIPASYIHPGNQYYKGIQIDMVIDRTDQVINLCEMKYRSDKLIISKKYADTLRTRREAFRFFTKTSKHIYNTVVTTYGVLENEYKINHVDQVITLEDLFLVKSF